MLGTALYYPHIDIRDGDWLRSAILFWDEVQTIVPTSIKKPYRTKDTRVCEQEGYLRPLRCDLHPEVLEDLGRRVFKLLDHRDGEQEFVFRRSNEFLDSSELLYVDKLSEELSWRLHRLMESDSDKLDSAHQRSFMQSGGLAMLYADALRRGADVPRVSSWNLSRLTKYRKSKDARDEESEWIMVSGKFAKIYMSALAALLSKETRVSALTNEVASSSINVRCLVDDVALGGETAARGALVSVVMQGLKIDPEASIRKLISFRRSRKEQIAELSGHFDDLKEKIEGASSPEELEEGAKRLFENKIQPGLYKLKRELDARLVGSVWDGVQRGFTVSAVGGSALAYTTGYTGPMLLGAAAFITFADVGMKSHFAKSKVRASSSYTYLLDVERKFVLPS